MYQVTPPALFKTIVKSTHSTVVFGTAQYSKINEYNTLDSNLIMNGKSGEELKQQLRMKVFQ